MDLERIYEVKTATIHNFERLWMGNYQNIKPVIARSPGVSRLFGRFTGIPALVVGAGPSLDKNIHWLDALHGRVIIIAVDTIHRALEMQGVPPTLTVTLDPQEDIGHFFHGVDTSRRILVAPTIAHPKALGQWKGDVMFYNKFAPDIPALTRIAQMEPAAGYLIPGGSVLSVGLDLAFRMGAPQVAFIGQDLCFPANTPSYAGGTIYGNSAGVAGQDSGEMVTDSDIFGRNMPTRKNFHVTKQWMEWAFTNLKRDEGPARFYNCTEGGIVTKNCNIVPLAEWAARFAGEKKNIEWQVKKALQKKRK
ncbi:MAG: DUF115 domain-containing protein [Nitrospinae bacterium]|nr:DUF115 domain-containing protein [Nitrospinota bacterium]